MSEMYKALTDFLPMFEDDKIGDWMIDRVNDGTPEQIVYLYYNSSDHIWRMFK